MSSQDVIIVGLVVLTLCIFVAIICDRMPESSGCRSGSSISISVQMNGVSDNKVIDLSDLN